MGIRNVEPVGELDARLRPDGAALQNLMRPAPRGGGAAIRGTTCEALPGRPLTPRIQGNLIIRRAANDFVICCPAAGAPTGASQNNDTGHV